MVYPLLRKYCMQKIVLYQGNWVHDQWHHAALSNPNRKGVHLDAWCLNFVTQDDTSYIWFPMEPILKICRPQCFCVCCVEALSVSITCTPVRFFFSSSLVHSRKVNYTEHKLKEQNTGEAWEQGYRSVVFSCHMQWAVRSNARWLQNPPGTYMTFDYSNYIYSIGHFPCGCACNIFH